MIYKSIFSGRLEFGSASTFRKVQEMFFFRAENYYKNDVLVDEEMFEETTHSFDVVRHIVPETNEKTWKNTINLLRYIAQYALAGSINAWLTTYGQVAQRETIEPRGDKTAVKSFLRGRKLVKKEGMETEAVKALTKAIEKYERHALAYERRGHVNFKLGNTEDAIYDYSKSIDFNPKNPEAYLGRAIVYLSQAAYEEAISDLGAAIKSSIPLQPIYWKARRMKAELHLKQEEFQAAIGELKLFTRRQFDPDNPNFAHRKRALFDYGKALLETGSYPEAIVAFEEALLLEGDVSEADQLLFKGIAQQKAGKSGYRESWQEAADRGSKRAADLLKESDSLV